MGLGGSGFRVQDLGFGLGVGVRVGSPRIPKPQIRTLNSMNPKAQTLDLNPKS